MLKNPILYFEIMQKKQHKDWLFYMSRLTVIIPILIIVVAFYLKYTGNQKPNNLAIPITPNITRPVSEDTVKGLESLLPKKASSSASFDLKGPWVCDYAAKDASTSAYVKDKKIYAKFKKGKELENILISGDCFYNWDKGEYTGKKMCGVSSYIDIFDTLQNFNFIDINTLLNYVPELNLGPEIKDLPSVLSHCVKGKVEDKLFIVPKNVLFKNFEISPTP